jgi:hypothetical protein
MRGQIHTPAALPSGMRPKCPLNRKLGWAQDRSGNLVKFNENLRASRNEILFFTCAVRSLVGLVSQHAFVLFRALIMGDCIKNIFLCTEKISISLICQNVV